jgi:hypothetical protein
MLRYAVILFVVLVGIALLSGNPRTRRVLWVLAGLALLYTILKLTGVIDAMAPGRGAGVF